MNTKKTTFFFFHGALHTKAQVPLVVYVRSIFLHAWRVTIGYSGLCFCVHVTSFKRQFTTSIYPPVCFMFVVVFNSVSP